MKDNDRFNVLTEAVAKAIPRDRKDYDIIIMSLIGLIEFVHSQESIISIQNDKILSLEKTLGALYEVQDASDKAISSLESVL